MRKLQPARLAFFAPILLLSTFYLLPLKAAAQDPDIQDEPFSETIFRTSDQAGEQPTSRRRGPFHGTTKRVSAPRGAVRLGCLCMDETRSDVKSTGACSGHGGVRFWLYRTVEGDTFRLSTVRDQSHPQPLDEAERSVLNQKTARKSAAMTAGHALAAAAPLMIVAPSAAPVSAAPMTATEAFGGAMDKVFITFWSIIGLAFFKMLFEFLKPLRDEWIEALRRRLRSGE